MKITNYWILLVYLTAWSCSDDSSMTYSPIEPGSGSRLEELLAESGTDSALRSAMASCVASESAVSDTAALSQVVQLSASGMGIRSLVGIDLLRSLQALDISENAIDDVTPLQGLSALELLDLTGNNVADISPLGSLHRLSVVVLDANPVSDLGPLLGLPVLTELSILGVTTPDSGTIRELEQRGVSVLSDLSTPQRSEGELGGTPMDLSEMAPRAITAAGSLWFVAGSSQGDARPVIAVSRDQGETWNAWSDTALVEAGVQRIDHLSIVVAATDTVAMLHSRTGWFRSLDSGVSWSPPAGLPSGFGIHIPMVFPEVTLAARNREPSWMTTLPGPVLLRSEDMGATWDSAFEYVWDYSFEAMAGQLIFVQKRALFRSFSPWNEKASILTLEDWLLIAVQWVSSDTALIATPTALYRTALSTGRYETVLTSEDGWSAARLYVDKGSDNAYLIAGGPLPDGYPMSIDADPYVDMSRILWRSEDAGMTWRRESIDGILELAIGESHAVMAVTENGLVRLD